MNLNFFILSILLTIGSCKSPEKSVINQSSEAQTIAVSTNQTPGYVINKRGEKIPLVIKSDAEWKNELTDQEFYVLHQKGTERAFTSELNKNKKEGIYICAACNTTLFNSNAKFDSGTGWPSFFQPEDKNLIKEDSDNLLGYSRTEVLCARCGGHLGHVFNDGPPPTGLRYCINGVSLEFIKTEY